MAKVIIKKDTAVNRAGAKMKKAGKAASNPKAKDSAIIAGSKIMLKPGKKAEKAAGNMTRKARKAK